jgi:hypothetical protein
MREAMRRRKWLAQQK